MWQTIAVTDITQSFVKRKEGYYHQVSTKGSQLLQCSVRTLLARYNIPQHNQELEPNYLFD